MAPEAQSPLVPLASLSTNHVRGPVQFTGQGGALPLVAEELPWEGFGSLRERQLTSIGGLAYSICSEIIYYR